jgi:hypothetical protein
MTDIITDRKIYRRRPMRGLKSEEPSWAALGDPAGMKLSELLALLAGEKYQKLYLCGSLEQMSREYVEEPLKQGWEFARPYIHKFRSPVYRATESAFAFTGTEVSVKLVGESWLPGCEDMTKAIPAWNALKAEWEQETAIPLLSTPSKTGQALLWESLPRSVEFPSLPDELATMIRAISPQHRLQELQPGVTPTHAYDGRWMYAGVCLADRLPVGEARKTGGFLPFQPGWYHVKIRVPKDWTKIGLIPRPCEFEGNRLWDYPNKPGEIIQAWVSEPELTLAVQNGWEIMDYIDGYAFDKGRPLAGWAKKLMAMRESLQDVVDSYGATPETRSIYRFAAAAVREILNHTIGSFHVNTYEREGVFNQAEWKELIEKWGYSKVRTLERLRGGKRRVTYPAQHSDRLSIYMPGWSSQIWALERAWIAKHALMCDPSTLVEIRGDCIYSTAPLPFEGDDKGHYSQLRRKEL